MVCCVLYNPLHDQRHPHPVCELPSLNDVLTYISRRLVPNISKVDTPLQISYIKISIHFSLWFLRLCAFLQDTSHTYGWGGSTGMVPDCEVGLCWTWQSIMGISSPPWHGSVFTTAPLVGITLHIPWLYSFWSCMTDLSNVSVFFYLSSICQCTHSLAKIYRSFNY